MGALFGVMFDFDPGDGLLVVMRTSWSLGFFSWIMTSLTVVGFSSDDYLGTSGQPKG